MEIDFASDLHRQLAINCTDLDANISAGDLIKLLDLMRAPDDASGLFDTLEGLLFVEEADEKSVIERTEEICTLNNNLPLYQAEIVPVADTAKRIIKISEQLVSMGFTKLRGSRIRSREDTSRRNKNKAPFYSCLIRQPQVDANDPGYSNLLAQLIVWAAHFPSSSELSKNHIKIFQAVRELCDIYNADELESLPSVQMDSTSYFSLLKQSAHDQLKIIGSLPDLSPIQTSQPAPSKQPEPTPHPVREKRKNTRSLPSSDEDNAWKQRSLKKKWTLLDENEAREYKKQGGDEQEFQPSADEIPIDLPEEIIPRFTFRELCFQAKQFNNRMALNNQLFAFSWQEASLFDVKILFDFFDSPCSDDHRRELQATLLLSFFLSAPVEWAGQLKAFSREATDESPEGIYVTPEGEWYVRVETLGPDLTEENRYKAWQPAHPVIDFSHVPLPAAWPQISAFFSQKAKKGERVSDGDDVSLLSAVDDILQELRRRHSCQLNRERVSTFIARNYSREEDNDLPKAALYLGTDIPLARTRIHYTIAHLQKQEQLYRKTCHSIFTQLQRPYPAGTDASINPNIHIGTPFCPRKDAVKKLANRMQSALKKQRSHTKQLRGILRFHNYFSIYCSVFSSYATSYRAVNKSSFRSNCVSPESGYAVIFDKDTPDFYNSRKVWFPPVFQQQLKGYWNHLLAMFDTIGLTVPKYFEIIQNHAWPITPSSYYIFTEPNDPNSLKPLTPSILRAFLAKHFDYDMLPNTNRHFLKNELIDSGCPQEVVEAFLGHWRNGQEPWNCQSSLHPLDYRQQLEKHLQPLLQTCGWQSIPGLTQ